MNRVSVPVRQNQAIIRIADFQEEDGKNRKIFEKLILEKFPN